MPVRSTSPVGSTTSIPHCALQSIPYGQVGDAVLEHVADGPAPAEVGDREHQIVAGLLDRVVEVEPAHARLDERIAELAVELEHAVHPAQADDDGAGEQRPGAAVAVVAAGRARPQRHAVLGRDPHDRLHLLDRVRAAPRRRERGAPSRAARTGRGTQRARRRRRSRARRPARSQSARARDRARPACALPAPSRCRRPGEHRSPRDGRGDRHALLRRARPRHAGSVHAGRRSQATATASRPVRRAARRSAGALGRGEAASRPRRHHARRRRRAARRRRDLDRRAGEQAARGLERERSPG